MQSSPTNTVPRQRSQLYKKIKGGGSVPELKNSLFIWMPSGTSGESVIRDRSSLTLARESVINSVTFTTQRETRYTPRIYRYHTAYRFKYHPRHLQLPSDPNSFYASRSMCLTNV